MTITLAHPINLTDQVFLGAAIRRRREELALSQMALAALFPINATIVSLWETDRRPVPHARLGRLANALELDLDELMAYGRVEQDGYIVHSEPRVPFEGWTVVSEPVVEVNVIEEEEVIEEPPFPPYLQHGRRWCASRHGSGFIGPLQWHHHGPAAR